MKQEATPKILILTM